MARNQPRSSNGRSAIARHVRFNATGNTNAINTDTVCGGGFRKGGAAPCATGFMTSFAQRNKIAAPATNPNFMFKFTPYSNPGKRAYGTTMG